MKTNTKNSQLYTQRDLQHWLNECESKKEKGKVCPDIPCDLQHLFSNEEEAIHLCTNVRTREGWTFGMILANYSRDEIIQEYLNLLASVLEKTDGPTKLLQLLSQHSIQGSHLGIVIEYHRGPELVQQYLNLLVQLLAKIDDPTKLFQVLELKYNTYTLGDSIMLSNFECQDQYLNLLSKLYERGVMKSDIKNLIIDRTGLVTVFDDETFAITIQPVGQYMLTQASRAILSGFRSMFLTDDSAVPEEHLSLNSDSNTSHIPKAPSTDTSGNSSNLRRRKL